MGERQEEWRGEQGRCFCERGGVSVTGEGGEFAKTFSEGDRKKRRSFKMSNGERILTGWEGGIGCRKKSRGTYKTSRT